MRSMPLILGFLLGLAAAAFTGCPTSTCSPANCALGCCDASGRCQLSASSTCGTKGSICATCRIDESCVSGTCMSSSSSGAGAAGGGTSGTGGGTSGTGSYSAFIDGFANGYCAKVIECGQLPGGSSSDCFSVFRPYVARSTGSLGGLATERGVRIGASTFDAAKAQACLAEIGRATCNGTSPQGSTASCNEVTRPAAAVNAPCDSNADCLDPTTSCNGQPCMRRCTTGGGQGEPCRAAGLACDAPYVCISGRCGTEPAPGTACDSFSSSCGPNSQCRNGVCERLPTVGQPCPNFLCAGATYCDSTRVCRDKKAIGQTCSLSSDCVTDAFCRSTVCTAKGTPGASCRSDSECAASTSCFEGSCRTRGAMAARCLRSQDCASALTCDEVLRTCLPYASNVATGQPCTNSAQRCQSFSEQCRNVFVNPDGGIGTRGTCATPMAGDACRGSYECASAQYCDTATMSCRAAGVSTPCSSDSNCRSTDFCATNGTGNTCAPKIATGQPCPELNSCAAPTDRCILAADGGTGRCGTVPALGQPCTSTCAFPSACSNGTCVMAGHVGEPCSPSTGIGCITGACQGPDGGIGYTPAGRCVGPQPNGTRCETDLGCQSGNCDRLGNSTCVAACN